MACVAHLRMWLALKSDNAEDAWGYLVDAQQACRDAINVRGQLSGTHDLSGLTSLLDSLEQIERVVFPPDLLKYWRYLRGARMLGLWE